MYSTLTQARQAWIASGAYRTISFKDWYNMQMDELINGWML